MPSQIVATAADPATLLPTLAEIVAGNRRGVLLWRDSAAAWIGDGNEDVGPRVSWLAAWTAGAVTVAPPRQPARSLSRFPVRILETIRPERLKESLQSGDDSLAACFLFAWPGPQPYRALAVLESSRDDEILQRLRALSLLARNPDDPCVIDVDARGRAALDTVLASLHEDRRKAEGLEAAWLGKSRSLIVRLAGVLELLATIDGKARKPGAIGKEQVEAGRALWRDYFGRMPERCSTAPNSDYAKRVRRVARWLLDKRPSTVTREEVRRRALSMTATADETQTTLQGLAYLGFVRADIAQRGGPGRPANRWLLNPALAESRKHVAEIA